MGALHSVPLTTHSYIKLLYVRITWIIKQWFRTWLWMANLRGDELNLRSTCSSWKARPSMPAGIAILIYNLVRTSFRAIKLLLLPHVLGRYLLATGTLHVLYEIVTRVFSVVNTCVNNFTVHGRRINRLRSQFKNAITYKEREVIGIVMDELEGKDKWRREPTSTLYDYNRVIAKTRMYKRLQLENDVSGLMFYLRAGLLRKHWGLGNPKLYRYSHVGTKLVIEEYMDTIVRVMDAILKAKPKDGESMEEYSLTNKLEFFNETRHAFGRSALLLSGGGALGLYHAGVIKTLVEHQMLPTVISGSSAGSIVAALVGVRTDEEITEAFKPGALNFQFFGTNIDEIHKQSQTPMILEKMKKILPSSNLLEQIQMLRYIVQRWSEQHYVFDMEVLKVCTRKNIGEYTFREAYDRTGRIINITVSAAHQGDYPQLLNYLTAPNVLVWSASCASCAIPGIFSPVELMAKDSLGNITPYHPEGLKWSDGSVECDLPMQRLSELFNVNHYIVSQVNAHYKILSGYSSFGNGKINALMSFFKKQMKSYIKHLFELGFDSTVFKFVRVAWIPLLTQSYEGDVTIRANDGVSLCKMVCNILSNPTVEEFQEICAVGERSTWAYIPRIRTMCQIEFALENAVRKLRAEKAIEDKKQGRIGRVPSFYTSYSNKNLVGMLTPDGNGNTLS